MKIYLEGTGSNTGYIYPIIELVVRKDLNFELYRDKYRYKVINKRLAKFKAALLNKDGELHTYYYYHKGGMTTWPIHREKQSTSKS